MSSPDPPTYLASLQNNIRQRPIPWDGAVRAGTLTEDQLARIRAVDKAKKDVRTQTVEADLDAYCALFVGVPGKKSVLESAAKRQDVVQYVLVLLADLLGSTSLPFRRCTDRLAMFFKPANIVSWQAFPRCPRPSYRPAIRTSISFPTSPIPPTSTTQSHSSHLPCSSVSWPDPGTSLPPRWTRPFLLYLVTCRP